MRRGYWWLWLRIEWLLIRLHLKPAPVWKEWSYITDKDNWYISPEWANPEFRERMGKMMLHMEDWEREMVVGSDKKTGEG